MAELVPHEAPMILVDEMVDWAPGRATCHLEIREGAPFVTAEGVHPVVTIEYMAQAVAACLGYEAFLEGEGVRVGMIIGCRKMTLERDRIPLGAQLVIEVDRIRGNEMLSHFDCRVTDADGLVATSTLTLYHAEKPPE